MKNVFKFEKETYNYSDNVLRILLSETLLKKSTPLEILTDGNDFFVPAEIAVTEGYVIYDFQIKDSYMTFEELKEQTLLDKLRAMANIYYLEKLVDSQISFNLHPNNIMFDENLMPKLLYRSIGRVDTQEFLQQYKCLALATFNNKLDFVSLYDGAVKSIKQSPFIKEIIAKKTPEELHQFLLLTYKEELEKTQSKKITVDKKHFKTYKYLSIWTGVIAALLGILSLYFLLFYVPKQDHLQSANTNFLKQNYDDVAKDLSGMKVKSIPKTSKYELAYSYIQSAPLSDSQKTTILNMTSLNSESNYLDYWIESGRGNLDEALDLAKVMEDNDLILYSLTQSIEQVKNSTKLSGKEREEKLSSLQSEYDKYKKLREEAVGKEK